MDPLLAVMLAAMFSVQLSTLVALMRVFYRLGVLTAEVGAVRGTLLSPSDDT